MYASANGYFRVAINGNTTLTDMMGQYYENGAAAPVAYRETGYTLASFLRLNYNFQETRNKLSSCSWSTAAILVRTRGKSDSKTGLAPLSHTRGRRARGRINNRAVFQDIRFS